MISEFQLKDIKDIINLGLELNPQFKELFNIDKLSEYENIIVYKEKNKLIGFLHYLNNIDYIEIINLIVLKEKRNNNIASFLINYLLNNFNKKIILEVRESNKPAINLYKKFNFNSINIRKNYYGNESGIVMERKKDIYILGVESSCDETSISIVKNGNTDIATTVLTQIDTHVNYGGVVPEIASRMHTENFTLVLEDLFNKTSLKLDDIDAIAVTYAPGLLGSLLVGLEFAKTLSFVYKKPLIKVHHIAGHIYSNNLNEPMEFPLLALIVSGGHTELVLMEDDYKFNVLGSTLDDAIGEVYDKVAKVLDLPYPGGPSIEKCALEGKDIYKLPIVMNNDELNFSFSGLKSAIINLVHNEKQKGNIINKNNIAISFQKAAIDQLVRKTRLAIEKTDSKRLIIAGGVSANKFLRAEMEKLSEEKNIKLSIPKMKYCTDNATMIAAAAFPLFLKKEFSEFNINAESSKRLY
ncbi:MAG: tRNA (adenosine(37)-N6)-threonylcarbamoyltransferase complex transferase subunit TsaD [Bacilli bacterium]|nr:tRNA (adenosine(37)-N6)-threonylcarbamoyltransferase complex transferase subunit TsaD [Bacilli bacterium]